MVKINLLPHREAKRKANKIAFVRWMVLAGIFGVAVSGMIYFFYSQMISDVDQRNQAMKGEITKLDNQIKEIADLKQEIEALKARQQAVEDLQSDRNQPVYLMDELVKQTPEGIYLKKMVQEGQKVSIEGYAQSNERLSDYLRNLASHSEWLEKPELGGSRFEISGQGRDQKRQFTFSMNFLIKRPRDKDKEKEKATASGPATKAEAAASAPPAASAPAAKS